jgi:protein disulfide-isomerase A1
MVDFMKKQNQPAYMVFSEASELEAWTADKTSFYAVAYVSSADSDLYTTFVGVAEKLRNDYSFALLTGADSEKVEGVVPGSDAAVFDGENTADAISAFLSVESFPLLGEIGPENFQAYVDRGFPIVWVFLDIGAGDLADNKAVATAAAANFKGVLSFVFLDGNRWKDHAKNFGLSGATPGVVIEDRQAGKNFILEGSLSEDALTKFAQGWVDGTVEAHIKSEDIPVPNDGPVTTIVGKNFDAIVMDETKDVLVEFYAPWCGHCKSLAPKWDQLGEEFENVDSVVIAKCDATANDTPAQVSGFPTIYWYPANSKASPVKYTGDRSVEAFAEYIRNNADVAIVESKDAAIEHDEL